MKRVFLIWLIAAGVSSILLNGCGSSEPQAPTPEFDYYPQTNVYFDKGNNTFIYSLDSGKTWLSYSPLSGKEPGTMGKHVVINSNTAEIWRHNDEHRRTYGGTILNFVTESSIADNVAERKLKRPVTKPRDTKEAKKEKKGLKGLFEKIFKKKKDADV